MSHGYFRHGILTVAQRPGLAGLLYGVNLVIGLFVTIPLYLALNSATATTGFSSDLATRFDIALWMDVMEDARPVLGGLVSQFFWIIPLILLWKIVASVGIISTLHTQGLRSFWQGIGEYTGKAILLALAFLIPILALVVGLGVSVFVLSMIWSGEVGFYWINIVLLPVSLVAGLALLDLMHDYARMELVIGGKNILDSILKGLSWPLRHLSSVGLYLVWFIIALLLVIFPTLLDVRPGGLWGVFVSQQLFLFVRAGVTIGWFGSEIDLYVSVQTAGLPAIARVEAEPHLAQERS